MRIKCSELKPTIKILLLLWVSFFCIKSNAQFYNGTQQTFGKNRPTYNQFLWTYHRAPQFDVYYYQGGEELATHLANFASDEITRLESLLKSSLNERIVFIVFNRLSDFRQSNIELVTGKEDYNLGGTNQLFRNKVSVYFESDYTEFEQQVSSAITELLMRQLLLGGSNKSPWNSDIEKTYPNWFFNGLKAFLSQGWSTANDLQLHSSLKRGKISKLNSFEGTDAEIVGQAFWFYFSKTFGLHAIPECLIITNYFDNFSKAIKIISGEKEKKLFSDFEQYWNKRLASLPFDSCNNQPVEPLINVSYKRKINQVGLSYDGDLISWVENNNGKKRIWVANRVTGKKHKIYTTGYRLKQEQDNYMPNFDWHPSANVLAFVHENKGIIYLDIVDTESKERVSRLLPNVTKISSLSYSPNGSKIYFSAVIAGKPNVFEYSITRNRITAITSNMASALNPQEFSNSKFAYVSNKFENTETLTDSEPVGKNQSRSNNSIWLSYNTVAPFSWKKLSHKEYETIGNLKWQGNNNLSFVSNVSGARKLYFGKIDSTVSHIDTAIHYSYHIQSQAAELLNDPFSQIDFNFELGTIAYAIGTGRKNSIFVEVPSFVEPEKQKSIWRTELEKGWSNINQKEKEALPPADSTFSKQLLTNLSPENASPIDVFSWVFEKEKLRYNLNALGYSMPLDGYRIDRISKIGYNLVFFPNKIVNQVDFNFLNSNYQPYTGAPAFFNPGLNLSFVVGAVDLFEDYRLYGGLSLGSDLESSEILLMYEYLGSKYKHQLAFQRQAYQNLEFDRRTKVRSHAVTYTLRFPFSQVTSVGGGTTVRYDRITIPSGDIETLSVPDDQRLWSGLKADLIFDNCSYLGFNLKDGVRFKFFAEAQTGIGLGKRADLYTFGFDGRTYTPVWRNIVLAARFAIGTSAGYAGLVYYLGSVDSWVNFNPMVPNFNKEIPVNNVHKLMFQTLATNLRGFSQNIRNGPSFGVINSEIRIPIYRTITNNVTGNKFLNSLQLVGFFDVGSAWKGVSPWHGENVWETASVSNGPVTVTFKTQRSPLVGGFGTGIRFQTMGYPLRFDYAWGIESGIILNPIFYFSTSLDF